MERATEKNEADGFTKSTKLDRKDIITAANIPPDQFQETKKEKGTSDTASVKACKVCDGLCCKNKRPPPNKPA